MKYYIEFKVKPYVIIDGDQERIAFNWKKEVSRADCNLKNHQNDYYNSDLFPRLLNQFYTDKKGQYRTWSFIDNLPEGCEIDCSGFLAKVKIDITALRGNR